MTESKFNCMINCVTDVETVEGIKQHIYLNAFRGCLVSLINEVDDIQEVRRLTALTITRAYTNGLISSDEALELMSYRRKAIEIIKERG